MALLGFSYEKNQGSNHYSPLLLVITILKTKNKKKTMVLE